MSNAKSRQPKVALRLAVVVGLLMAGLSLTVQPATAATNVPYIDPTLGPQIASTATDLTSSSTAWTTGWYVLSSSQTISSRIVVTGDVDLILADGFTLTASQGITVAAGNSLTIYGQSAGTGTLTTGTPSGTMAGIGGDASSAATATAGTITINGGNVSATGGDMAAGLGGASSPDGTIVGAGGTITINGGTVTAMGGANHGPGIGGGGGGDGGNVTITGGGVTATGGPYGGAGIGGGAAWNNPAGAGGTITISGGTVTATGNSSAYGGGAGLGGGGGDNYTGSYPGGGSGTITITGTANVTATGGSGVSAIWPIPSGGGGGAAIGGGGTNGDPGGPVTGNIYIDSTATISLTAGTGVSAGNGALVGTGGANSAAGTELLPTAPQDLTAAPSNAQVTLDWTPPATTGQPINSAGYTVEISYDAGANWTPLGNVGNVLTYTVTGLTNGTSYTFGVYANNPAGAGAWATIAAAPMTVPGAPTGVAATPGDAQAVVSFSPPASDGGSTITGYTVTATPTGGGTPITATGTTSPITVTGLVNGAEYAFTVAATNAAGTGPDSVAANATPITTPDAPEGVTATPATGQVTLTWAAPLFDGGSPITNYEVSADGGSTYTPLTPPNATATSYTFTGLTDGTAYTLGVRAINAAGPGTEVTVSATPGAAPSSPQNPTVSAVGNGTATLTWLPPSSNGGFPITNYEVSADGGTTFAPLSPPNATATSYTFTGLTNGTTYQLSVRAVNSVGTGASSAAVDATPNTVPGAPQGVTVVPGDTQATVSFSPPTSDGGSAITGYTVTATPTAGGAAITAAGTSSPITVTGLTNGTEYAFTVTATNVAGTGSASAPQIATPLTVPSVPQNLAATPGDGQVELTWTAPASDGGSPVTNYEVSADGGTTFSPLSPPNATATSYTFTSLTNGTAYALAVRAVNAAGSGPAATTTATPLTVPDAPTGVTATSGNTQVVVAFTPPTSDGGSAITGYTVTATPTGGGAAITATGTASPITVTGLINGTEYAFTVTATNSAGTGPASTAATATPMTVPTEPQGLSVSTAVAQEALLTWTAPADDGGSPITDYQVSDDGGATWTSLGSATATTYNFTNQTAMGPVYYCVRAVNAVGEGATASSPALPTAAPSAPQNAAVTVASGQGTVTFDPPASDGNTPITSYTVTATPTGGGAAITATGAASPITVTGLTNGTEYAVTVTATNAAGTGPASTAVNATPITTPGAPQGLTASPADGEVTLSWAAPASNGGSSITNYLVSTNGGVTFTDAGNVLSYTATGLTDGVNYVFAVQAVNAAGSGPSATTAAAPLSVPGAPQSVTVAPGNTGATVVFVAPASDGGSPVTGYTVTATPTKGGTAVTATGTGSPITVTGLTNGTEYAFTVTATNAAGTGPASAPVAAVPSTTPDAPTGFAVQPGNGTLALSWGAPSGDGGSALTGYEYSTDGGGTWQPVPGGAATLAYTVGGLTNGTTYNVSVRALNVNGAGPEVAFVAAVPATVPSAPTITSLTPGNAHVVVAFTAPTSDGGSAVSGYVVTATPTGATVAAAMPLATTVTATGGSSPIDVTGLVNGAVYSFTVAATNSAGTGPASAAATATPFTTSNPPAALTATPGNGQVRLSWNAPGFNGGAAITNYEVSSDNGLTWTPLSPANPAATGYTFTGLTNGATSVFAVRAINAGGFGQPAKVSAAPRTVPAEPTGVTLTPGNGQLTVHFTAPTDNGGSPVLRYLVTATPLSGGPSITVTGPASPITVTGLVGGTSYSVTVVAINAAGGGASSQVVTGQVPLAPAPPPGDSGHGSGNLVPTGGMVTASAYSAGFFTTVGFGALAAAGLCLLVWLRHARRPRALPPYQAQHAKPH